jgi:hypothetical protein
MNICFTHQFLFGSLGLYVQFFFGLTVFIELIVIFLFQFLTASVSTKIHKSEKYLARIQRNITKRSLFCLRIKFKLLTYFERLRSNRKIGLAIGSVAVMTLPLFYRVMKINNLILNVIKVLKNFLLYIVSGSVYQIFFIILQAFGKILIISHIADHKIVSINLKNILKFIFNFV